MLQKKKKKKKNYKKFTIDFVLKPNKKIDLFHFIILIRLLISIYFSISFSIVTRTPTT